MEPIEVTVRFDREGNPSPLNFIWREKKYRIISVGRDWQDDAGRHILVMSPGDRVHELVFSPSEMRWYLSRLDLDRESV